MAMDYTNFYTVYYWMSKLKTKKVVKGGIKMDKYRGLDHAMHCGKFSSFGASFLFNQSIHLLHIPPRILLMLCAVP